MKKPFEVICFLYKKKQIISLVDMDSKELWLVQENHATIKLDLSVASHGMKTYSESKIELQNLQIVKKTLVKYRQFLSSEQPCELKSLDIALNIAEVEKIHSQKLRLQSRLEVIQSSSSFEWKEH